jgi:hypothetical protein
VIIKSSSEDGEKFNMDPLYHIFLRKKRVFKKYPAKIWRRGLDGGAFCCYNIRAFLLKTHILALPEVARPSDHEEVPICQL